MSSRTVRYWFKTDENTYEPLATNKQGLKTEMQAKGLCWCSTCNAAVEPEGRLDADGIYEVCPFCGEEVK